MLDKNKPYVKVYENGLVTNKITKDNPVRNFHPNRRQRRDNGGREISNKKGISLVITKIGRMLFEKTIKRIDNLGKVHYHGK